MAEYEKSQKQKAIIIAESEHNMNITIEELYDVYNHIADNINNDVYLEDKIPSLEDIMYFITEVKEMKGL